MCDLTRHLPPSLPIHGILRSLRILSSVLLRTCDSDYMAFLATLLHILRIDYGTNSGEAGHEDSSRRRDNVATLGLRHVPGPEHSTNYRLATVILPDRVRADCYESEEAENRRYGGQKHRRQDLAMVCVSKCTVWISIEKSPLLSCRYQPPRLWRRSIKKYGSS